MGSSSRLLQSEQEINLNSCSSLGHSWRTVATVVISVLLRQQLEQPLVEIHALQL